jgi:hypothetical protein
MGKFGIWLSNLANRSLSRFTLFVGFCGSVVGVLVDIDHPLGKIFGWQERQLHIYLLVLALCVAIYCLAHLGRYFRQ